MITIIDYGLGNIQAFTNIYKRLNIRVQVAMTATDVLNAEKIILPGVGAFDWAMTRLNDSGMRDVLDDLVINKRIPVLGICVGMQMMAESSEEGVLKGLGWIKGIVKKFDTKLFVQKTHLPHMGWNEVVSRDAKGLFKNIDNNARFYFLHSYFFEPLDPEYVLAVTDYNGSFASSVHLGSAYGVQFHPEKSHQWGIQLLKNFSELS
jgi:glutamine amidotransferase